MTGKKTKKCRESPLNRRINVAAKSFFTDEKRNEKKKSIDFDNFLTTFFLFLFSGNGWA